MDTEKFLLTALSVLSVVAIIGWVSGEYLLVTKIVAIAGTGFFVSAYLNGRENRGKEGDKTLSPEESARASSVPH